jgi:hypothetical protein
MKIIKNDKLIERNAKISNYLSIASLLVLAAVAYFAYRTISNPSAATLQSQYILIGLVVVSMFLTSIGNQMGKNYGRSPRPDEKIDAALKGLPGEISVYHYATPASHLLVGPAGIWVIVVSTAIGKVGYSKNRWRISGGGFSQKYLRFFGQEGVGRPDVEADSDVKSLRKEFAKHMEVEQIPPISAVLVFTEENVELDISDAPMPAIKVKQIKDFMLQKAREKAFSAEAIEKIKAIL